MGYLVELNTLLGLPNNFDPSTLNVGAKYKIIKDRERAFPLHIAVLIVDSQWNFYGYCRVNSAIVKDLKQNLNLKLFLYLQRKKKKHIRKDLLKLGDLQGK